MVGGTVTIVEQPISQTAPSGFEFLSEEIKISAPSATVDAPLMLVFKLDQSRLPSGQSTDRIHIARNRVVVGACTATRPIAPNPCESSRTTVNGDLVITVLTSDASTWDFAFDLTPDLGDAGAPSDGEKDASEDGSQSSGGGGTSGTNPYPSTPGGATSTSLAAGGSGGAGTSAGIGGASGGAPIGSGSQGSGGATVTDGAVVDQGALATGGNDDGGPYQAGQDAGSGTELESSDAAAVDSVALDAAGGTADGQVTGASADAEPVDASQVLGWLDGMAPADGGVTRVVDGAGPSHPVDALLPSTDGSADLAAAAPAGSKSDSGCGCSLGSKSTTPWHSLLWLALALVGLRRARRSAGPRPRS